MFDLIANLDKSQSNLLNERDPRINPLRDTVKEMSS